MLHPGRRLDPDLYPVLHRLLCGVHGYMDLQHSQTSSHTETPATLVHAPGLVDSHRDGPDARSCWRSKVQAFRATALQHVGRGQAER